MVLTRRLPSYYKKDLDMINLDKTVWGKPLQGYRIDEEASHPIIRKTFSI